jgi:hypothetical protein
VTRAALAGGLLAAAAALATPARAGTDRLADGTARTLPARAVEVGVFGPLRVGLSDRVTLSLHPGWSLVAPSAAVTVAWGEALGVELASQHALAYPTPLMRLLSRQGTGGVLPTDVTYPHLLAASSHLLASRAFGAHLVTLRAGGQLGIPLARFEGPRFWSEVEWHLVWARTAAWTRGWSLDGGLSALGPLWGRLGYRAELDAFYLPRPGADRALEWALLGTWRPRPGLQLALGARWSWAVLPYGTRLSVPFPLADVAWSFDAPAPAATSQ